MLVTWVLLVGFLIYLSTAFADFKVQLYFSGVLIVILFLTKLRPDKRMARIFFLGVASFIVVRYFSWRTLYTVEYTEWVSFSCAMILYLAEAYGIMVFMIGNFVNLNPIARKPVALPPDETLLPTIDVYVPSYNESKEILEVTLTAASQMRYPEDKKRIFLLDDGGTDQKCMSGPEDKQQIARARREELQELCVALGATYMTRAKNRHAKAGNLNEGFHRTSGELVVIFDADHVPTEDFLEKTVGLFLEDQKLFLVQTPHFFVNPDPIEKNLDTFHQMPSENEMFYRVIQPGLDFWNSAFFCGSGAVMRRTCLEVTGGLSGDTITEDAETALTLHSKGFNSAYIPIPLLSGLSPETMGGFIQQRIRWATGMVQIFLLKNPLFLKGLSFPQRLCYFNSCFFWFFPFARLVYLLAPVAFLFFGLKIYAANWQTFVSYVIPHMIAVLTVSNFLYGKVRWSFVSELYELIQSIYTMPAILATFLNPRAPTFNVTPKGEQLSRDFISPLIIPFYLLAAINVGTIIAGIIRLNTTTADIYPIAITLFWSVFNAVLLLGTLGAMLERKQRRASPRMPAKMNGQLIFDEKSIPVKITDLSLGGCKLAMKGVTEHTFDKASAVFLQVEVGADRIEHLFHLELRNLRPDDFGDEMLLGASFDHLSLEERKAKVRLVTGSSMRWVEFQKRRESRLGVLGSFVCLAYIGVKHTLSLVSHLFSDMGSSVTGRGRKIETQTMEV